MIRTVHDAVELLRRSGIVTVVPTGDLPSIVEAVVGGPVRGSWWGHAKGKLIFRLASALTEREDVLTLKLVEGKVTFVERRLWPAVYRVVMDGPRRRAALTGLSKEAQSLLALVERRKRVRMDQIDATKKAREALEERLLVHSGSVHTELGKHVTELQAWKAWASAEVRAEAERLEMGEALDELREVCAGAAKGLGTVGAMVLALAS